MGARREEARIEFVRAKDRSTIGIEVSAPGREPLFMEMSPAEADEMISDIARVRMGLSDAVPEVLEPRAIIPAVWDPIWRPSEKPPRRGYRGIDVRHPGYGWQRFVFDRRTAKEIAAHLEPDREDPAANPPRKPKKTAVRKKTPR